MLAERFDAPSRYDLAYAGFASWYPERDLPEARRSVQELAQLRSWSGSAQAWTGQPQQALSPEAFWQQAGKAQVLHLSLHGRTNWRDPMASSLYFPNTDSLTAGQLYERPFPAELVILDAYEMGIGQAQRGEGVLSMATSFA